MLHSLNACRSSIGLRTVGLLIVFGGLLCALPTLLHVSAQAAAPPADTRPQPGINAQPDLQDENAGIADEPKSYDGKDFDWWRRNLRTELKPELRAEALTAMGHFGANGYAEQATATIMDSVKSYARIERGPGEQITDAAQSALWYIGPSTTDALVAALSAESNNVRHFAVSTLVKSTPNEAIVQALIAATRNNDLQVRQTAVNRLGRVGMNHEHVIPALTAALTDEDVGTRSSAAASLGKLESRARDAVPDLIAAAKDQDLHVRYSALYALARIQPEPEVVVPTFTDALNDENRDVIRQAYQYLGSIGPEAKSAVPALIDAYSRVLNPDDQRRIIQTLGQIGPDAKQALPLLTRALQEEDEHIQSAAVEALKKITE